MQPLPWLTTSVSSGRAEYCKACYSKGNACRTANRVSTCLKSLANPNRNRIKAS
jgi:hypothetical protein